MTKRAAKNPPPHGKRGPLQVRERMTARVLRAAKKAGSERVEIDPQTGRYFVILKEDENKNADSEVESWLSKQKS
jgi:hypothetical protein